MVLTFDNICIVFSKHTNNIILPLLPFRDAYNFGSVADR